MLARFPEEARSLHDPVDELTVVVYSLVIETVLYSVLAGIVEVTTTV